MSRVVTKDAELCRRVEEALTEPANNTGEFSRWSALTSPIQWRRGTIELVDRIDVEYAEFDINNDGHSEIISRWRHWHRGVEEDDLAVFFSNAPSFSGDKVDSETYMKLPGIRSEAGGYHTYSIELNGASERYRALEKYQHANLGRFTVEPFVHDGKVNLLISDSALLSSESSPNWTVVARYLDHSIPIHKGSNRYTNALNILCVYEF
jgi:hypothetical protein